MCGIYGINKKQTKEQLDTILKLADFRGPDFSRVSICDDYSFGHNRLAIIDLDSRSNQPFKIDNYEIVFNGEIYNYQEIKNELIKKADIALYASKEKGRNKTTKYEKFIEMGKNVFYRK